MLVPFLRCSGEPYLAGGLLPKGDFEIRCNDHVIALAICRNGTYDIFVWGSHCVRHVIRNVPCKNILAEVKSMIVSG